MSAAGATFEKRRGTSLNTSTAGAEVLETPSKRVSLAQQLMANKGRMLAIREQQTEPRVGRSTHLPAGLDADTAQVQNFCPPPETPANEPSSAMLTINDREDRDASADSNQIPASSARPPYKAANSLARTAEPAARRARPPAPQESQEEPRSTKSKLTYASLFAHDQQEVVS